MLYDHDAAWVTRQGEEGTLAVNRLRLIVELLCAERIAEHDEQVVDLLSAACAEIVALASNISYIAGDALWLSSVNETTSVLAARERADTLRALLDADLARREREDQRALAACVARRNAQSGDVCPAI